MKVIGRGLELGPVVGGWLSDTMMKSFACHDCDCHDCDDFDKVL